MSMNRQARRMAEKQGLVDGEGAAVATKRERGSQGSQPRRERTAPRQFVKEVRSELSKVKWPTREEVINYSLIVCVLVVVLTAAVAGLDYLFGNAVLALFDR